MLFEKLQVYNYKFTITSYGFINTVVWLSLQSQAFRNNKKKQFYFDKTIVNFWKGCDVHKFVLKKL